LLFGEIENSGKIRRLAGRTDAPKLKFKGGFRREPRTPITSALFSHPLIDTLSQPGTKPSYIAPSCFAEAFIQVLSDGGSLTSLRLKLDDRNTPLGKLFGPMLDQANGEIENFKSRIESHFSLVMDRVSGWYKRRSQGIMFIIGFLLAAALNVDTIYITQKFKASPDLVAQLVESSNKLDTTTSTLNDTSGVSAEEIKNLKEKFDTLKEDINKFENMALPIGWNECTNNKNNICLVESLGLAVQEEQKGYSIKGWPILGWFITALTATLGGPFWFDAISKLFTIRGAGIKPEQPTTASANPTSQTTIQPVATPIRQKNNQPLNDYEASRLNGEDIEALERALGLPEDLITGKLSEELRSNLRNWQHTNKRPVTGRFEEESVLTLLYPQNPVIEPKTVESQEY